MIWQFRAGRCWLVLTISAGFWAVSQFWNTPNPPALLQLGYFNLFSWQLLFALGLTLGYFFDRWKDCPNPWRWSLLLCGTLCLALFALRQTPRLGVSLPAMNSSLLVAKPTLGAVRLLNFFAMAYVLRVVLRWIGAGVQGYWVYQKLAFLGQHSLQVFSWSVMITYLAYLSGESWWHLPVAVQVCLSGVAILILWVPAWLHVVWKNRRRWKPLWVRQQAAGSA
jgi:hypothetical protein